MGAVNIKPIPKSRGLTVPDFGLNHIACAENWQKIRNHFQVFNVLDYGAKGDGVTDDSAAIDRAVAAAVAAGGGTVLAPPGTYLLSDNLTTDETVTLQILNGGILSIASGKVLTINGPFEAGLYQVFSGSGTVTGLKRADAEWFGPFTTATEKAAALVKALAASARVTVSGGTYDPVDISVTGRTLTMRAGVIFKVPNGAISSTTGVPALKISGEDTTIYGDFSLDGNSANQDVSSFAGDARDGTLEILDHGSHIYGRVTIVDAPWIACRMEGGSSSGTEIEDLHIDSLYVENSHKYALLPWSVNGWRVDNIDVVSGANTVDSRIRTGTATALGECLNGHIKSINSDAGVVIEKRTRKLRMDRIICTTLKFEDSADIEVGSAGMSAGDNDTGQLYFNNCARVYVGSATLVGYDSGGTTEPAVNVNTSGIYSSGDPYTGGGVHIGVLTIKDTVDADNQMRVRKCVDLHIGKIFCINPPAGTAGILFDFNAAFAPQQNVWIGEIFAEGHTTYDLNIESGFINVHVLSINSTAVRSNLNGGPTYVGDNKIEATSMAFDVGPAVFNRTVAIGESSDSGFTIGSLAGHRRIEADGTQFSFIDTSNALEQIRVADVIVNNLTASALLATDGSKKLTSSVSGLSPQFTGLSVTGNNIIIATAKTPSSASDTGTKGMVAWDANFIYICTATDTWKRVAIATW